MRYIIWCIKQLKVEKRALELFLLSSIVLGSLTSNIIQLTWLCFKIFKCLNICSCTFQLFAAYSFQGTNCIIYSKAFYVYVELYEFAARATSILTWLFKHSASSMVCKVIKRACRSFSPARTRWENLAAELWDRFQRLLMSITLDSDSMSNWTLKSQRTAISYFNTITWANSDMNNWFDLGCQ